MGIYIDTTAIVDNNTSIGDGGKVWHFTHLESDCEIGNNVMIGQGCYVGKGVKIQNNVSVYSGVVLERDVFCGPSCVFTNDLNPRVNYPKNKKYLKTIVRKGATIGANVTLICGIEVGEYAFIGAGSVATKPVLAYELVYGNPAVHKGWICKCGTVLNKKFECPKCGMAYAKNKDGLFVL